MIGDCSYAELAALIERLRAIGAANHDCAEAARLLDSVLRAWPTKCFRCKKARDNMHRYGGYCSKCHNAYRRATRPKHSELTDEQRRRANCRSYTHVLIKRGQIVKQPCEVCSDPKVEAHHDDYDNPRRVRWLCRKHHRAEERRVAAA